MGPGSRLSSGRRCSIWGGHLWAASPPRRPAGFVQGNGRHRSDRLHRIGAANRCSRAVRGSPIRPPAATSSTARPAAPTGRPPNMHWSSPTKTARPFTPAHRGHCLLLRLHDVFLDAFRIGKGRSTSAAGTARLRSSWRRPSSAQRSPASTSASLRSSPPTQPQPRPVSETLTLLREAGFSHMRRATENPFTIVPEAEP
jgi:hypothetical protein